MSRGYSLAGLFVTVFIAACIVFFLSIFVPGCKQRMTRNLGGSMTYTLEPQQRLINVTWKDNSLWVLTEARPTEVPPKTYKLQEKSSLGVLQGTVTIKEQ